VTTPVVVAERIVAANIATGALEVDWWPDAVRTCWKIVDAQPEIGMADASLTGEAGFTLLPADAL
jgi:hypothetical protein